MSAITFNKTLEGGNTGKRVGGQPNGQVPSRMLVADLAVIAGIVLSTLWMIEFACCHLQVVKSNGVASVGEGEGVGALFQGDQGGTPAGQEILEGVGWVQGYSRD